MTRITMKRDIIVIGGSSGSGTVLKKLVAELPADLAASILIVTHRPAQGSNFLEPMLARDARMPVIPAVNGLPIEAGRIYLAGADAHLLVIDNVICLGLGPRENMARPAIDPLFRSAALSFGSRVIAVVLTGMLNDGASGLAAVKARGGTVIVQHPLDAEANEMPLAALETVDADHVVSARDLARTLIELVGSEAGPTLEVDHSLQLEVQIAAGKRLGSDALRTLAEPSALSCPDCHGVLSEMKDTHPLRYRCQTGHAYTAEVLDSRIEQVDEAIRVAMRIMEERVTLVERMARDAREAGRRAVAELYEARAVEYRRYAIMLRNAAVSSLRSETPENDQ